MRKIFFFLAVLLSGAAGLIYQTLWIRKIAFCFGNTTLSVSLVLSSFFFGLAAGGLVLGRAVDRSREPLRFYAWLEAGIAVSAAAVYLVLGQLDSAYVYLYRNFLAHDLWLIGALKLVLSFVVLLMPTFLMGGTLPALLKSYTRNKEDFTVSLGSVYAVNTIGAFAGLMVMAFALIELLGLAHSYGFCIALSLVSSSCAFAAAAKGSSAFVPENESESNEVSRAPTGLYVLAFMQGAICLGYEVLWFRLWSIISMHSSTTLIGMAPAEISSTYVYSLILGILLIGISIGGALRKPVQRLRGSVMEKLAAVQFLIGIYAMVSLILERRLAFDGVTVKMLEMVAIILPMTVLMGIGFPLLGSAFVDSMKRSGRQFGGFYAVNTLGSSLGPLLAGMVLLPAAGTYASLLVMGYANMFIAFILVMATARGTDSRRLLMTRIVPASLVATAVLVIQNVVPLAVHPVMAGGTVLYERDNSVAHTLLLRQPDGDKRLIMNNNSVSGITALNRFGRQSIQIPAALMGREPKDILILCVGSGGSWKSTTRYTNASTVVVDINPAVFECMPLIHDPETYAEMTRPATREVVTDARNYLLLDERQYDLINIDPAPPISQPGMVNLHTREFYRLAKARLKPGGILFERLSGNVKSEFLYRALVKSAMDNFRHVQVWRMLGMGMDIIASDADLDTLHTNPQLIDPDLVPQLDHWFVASRDQMEDYVRDIPPVTDDQPLIEYYLLRSWGWLPSTDPWNGPASSLDALTKLKQPLNRYIHIVAGGDEGAN